MNRKAYVLIETEMGMTISVANELREKSGVAVSDVVIGPHDIVAVVHGPDDDAIAKIVLNEIQSVKGVQDTTTYMVIDGASKK
jgi:DNA-binding Lrp family transcriptional regulator